MSTWKSVFCVAIWTCLSAHVTSEGRWPQEAWLPCSYLQTRRMPPAGQCWLLSPGKVTGQMSMHAEVQLCSIVTLITIQIQCHAICPVYFLSRVLSSRQAMQYYLMYPCVSGFFMSVSTHFRLKLLEIDAGVDGFMVYDLDLIEPMQKVRSSLWSLSVNYLSTCFESLIPSSSWLSSSSSLPHSSSSSIPTVLTSFTSFERT